MHNLYLTFGIRKEFYMTDTKAQNKFLIIESRYYAHIADMMLKGACDYLEANNVSYDRLEVPGALEIPSALSFAARRQNYDGYIVL